jgi:hypothetical protein
MTVIEIRPHRWGWKVFEALGVEPVFAEKNHAIGYAKHRSGSHRAVIRVYDASGNVIGTREHAGEFKEWSMPFLQPFDGCFPLEQGFSVMVTLVR